MTDIEPDAPAYPIQWNAPAPSTVSAAWNGPSPRATSPAPTGDPRAEAPAPAPQDANQAPVGWAGSTTDGQTAQDYSQASASNGGFGWSGPEADGGPRQLSGASRFDAPDRDDHAPRVAQPSEPGVAQPVIDHPVAEPNVVQQTPAVQPQQHTGAPASYSPAPTGGQTGADAAYPPVGQRTTSPQVVTQHDDLPEDSLTIGRSRDNGIVLDDMLVSRRHVVITADEEGLLLRDLGSRNGTFVNGRRVEQTHLHEGDRIGVGASTFEVRDGWLVSV